MVTKELTTNGAPVSVHAISTGLVSVKTKFRETVQKGLLAVLSFLLDRQFTEWMPIWTWVIEHPEGIFLIDTGENSNVTDEDYFKSSGLLSNWINTTQFKFQVERGEEIDRQLQQLGIEPDQVDQVILTHLHLDHIDGLKHFPNNEVLVHKLEQDKPYGVLPKLFPAWYNPTTVVLDESFQTFDQAKALTENKDLIMVHTPGHTYGHTSVILKTDEGYILFAGDVVYYEEQLRAEKYAGANVDFKEARASYANIRAFAKQNRVVVLPSHDMGAAERLSMMKPLYEVGKG